MTRAANRDSVTFNDAISALRAHSFDVRETPGVANRVEVRKYGCGAMLARTEKGGIGYAGRPGCILGDQVAALIDRGYQKFLTTSKVRIAATAERLQNLHRFEEELNAIVGRPDYYNLALGTVSDIYLYDRVKGRELDTPADAATH